MSAGRKRSPFVIRVTAITAIPCGEYVAFVRRNEGYGAENEIAS
ncbi:hypothetical protein ZOD2009_14216 [Haladaptatus paucihalophilus DX253]|uniref:Uncharacterized protein n=1 Tax=Haladaptatus paucihalophilus DX253 TaxID=797209 RepID=E7QVK7_HALPU|nr:hypothetical protein ZOD2009_14216 [Haladaptatus paucihalophilus DX253]